MNRQTWGNLLPENIKSFLENNNKKQIIYTATFDAST